MTAEAPPKSVDHYGGGYCEHIPQVTYRSSHADQLETVMHYSDTQKWYYLKNQMPDEVLVFCCYDSTVSFQV